MLTADTNSAQSPDDLLDALQQSGLTPVSAIRAAFLLRASAVGWSDARIARQLGVTRMRVNQRKKRLRSLHNPHPVVAQSIVAMDATPATIQPTDRVLQFDSRAWDDIEFGRAMLDTIQ